MKKANFGFMGLGVIGHMLALNMERNGFRVAGYDLDAEKVESFGTKCPGKNLVACAHWKNSWLRWSVLAALC